MLVTNLYRVQFTFQNEWLQRYETHEFFGFEVMLIISYDFNSEFIAFYYSSKYEFGFL